MIDYIQSDLWREYLRDDSFPHYVNMCKRGHPVMSPAEMTQDDTDKNCLTCASNKSKGERHYMRMAL